MASRHRFFRHIRLRLAKRNRQRAARSRNAAQRQSARSTAPRLGGARAARAAFAAAMGSMPDDLRAVYTSVGDSGIAATRNLIDSFLSVSRRYLCL